MSWIEFRVIVPVSGWNTASDILYNKIPIYPIFYLLKGDYKELGFRSPLGFSKAWGFGGLGFKAFSGLEFRVLTKS